MGGMQNGQNCQCGSCQMGHHGCCGHGHNRFLILRWILGLLILGIVFVMGVKIGEFKNELDSGYYGMSGGFGKCTQ